MGFARSGCWLLLLALGSLLLVTSSIGVVADESRFTAEDVLVARSVARFPRTQCIIDYEVGGLGYDPYVLGAEGEVGAGQLHPRGLLPVFFGLGYSDPHDPVQVVDFIDLFVELGRDRAWSPVRLGYC